MAKLKEYFQFPVIRSAVILGFAVGISIVGEAWAFKKFMGRPVPILTGLIPVILLCGHECARPFHKKLPWLANTWIWAALIVLATVAVIIYNYVKYA